MNSKYIIAIVATVLVMFFLFSQENKKSVNSGADSKNEIEDVGTVENKANPVASKAARAASEDTSASVHAASMAPQDKAQVSEQVMRQFSMHLKAMAKCLGLPGQQNIGEKTEPTLENLQSILKANFGEVVIQMEDWAQTEFTEAGGVRKRVRVDYDYPEGATPVRRLSMYLINSYNMPEIINLSADETNNPNEAYIASLTEGQNLINVEKAGRAYFAEGEEVILSTKNNLLQSLSVTKSDRSFNCFNLEDESSNCNCL